MIKTVGFIGLGMMGLPMAKRVARAYDLVVCDLRPEPIEEMKKLGAREAALPAELAAFSDAIITMVMDDAQTERVILGHNGVLAGAREGASIMLTSTLSPGCCKKVAEAAKAKGVDVLDAPVSGASIGAEKGELVICVGGDGDVLERCRPVLMTMARAVIHAGDCVGLAQTVKLANNMAMTAILQVTTEAITWAMKSGASEESLLQFIGMGTANSWVVQNWGFLRELQQKAGTLSIGIKDLSLGLATAHEAGQACPFGALALETLVQRNSESSK